MMEVFGVSTAYRPEPDILRDPCIRQGRATVLPVVTSSAPRHLMRTLNSLSTCSTAITSRSCPKGGRFRIRFFKESGRNV
jgi:hypothetical protein